MRAYGAFANGGYIVEPYAIEKIVDSRGRILYQATGTKTSHQLSKSTAAKMTAMMKTVITSGTGTGANIGKPAAGKTGTTDDYRDAYFVGYTPDIVTGVWVGDDNNKQMHGLTGGTIPAKIWKDVMLVATQKYGSKDFDYPEIVLTDKSKDAEEVGAEDELEQTEETEALLKEAQELKEKALESTQTQQQSPQAESVEKRIQDQPSAPIPKTESIPMAVPESLR